MSDFRNNPNKTLIFSEDNKSEACRFAAQLEAHICIPMTVIERTRPVSGDFYYDIYILKVGKLTKVNTERAMSFRAGWLRHSDAEPDKDWTHHYFKPEVSI